jgi:signal transduction histidine kinase
LLRWPCAKGPGGVAVAFEDGAEGIRVAGGNGAEVEVEIFTGPVEVFADPLLEKVRSNLLENATKHGRGGSHQDPGLLR